MVCSAEPGEGSISLIPSGAGVTLQVEAAGDRQAESFTFYKSATRAVSIGRKSKQPRPMSFTPLVSHSALFLCPVVSRKHAKITLTEYGNVSHSFCNMCHSSTDP